MKTEVALTILCVLGLCPPAELSAGTPNVVVILCDDLGYGDVGCYNPHSRIPTPRIDRLAAEGMRFSDAHTPSAVCTPTRYGLLTGRYCWRTALKEGVLDGFDPPLIESGRTTLASLARQHGYRTACVGKWHLGADWRRRDGQPMPSRGGVGEFRPGTEVDFTRDLGAGPLDCGFDSWFGISASLDMAPYCFIEDRRTIGRPTESAAADKTLFLNQSPGVTTPGFSLEGVLPALTHRAVEIIEGQAGRDTPFLLYLALSSPHLPVVPGPQWRGKTGAGLYADFVAETDAGVGAVLDALGAPGPPRTPWSCSRATTAASGIRGMPRKPTTKRVTSPHHGGATMRSEAIRATPRSAAPRPISGTAGIEFHSSSAGRHASNRAWSMIRSSS